MIQFNAVIKKFGRQGEKTGWTYITVSQEIADILLPGNKRSFRVKGKIDQHPVKQLALLPMGDGTFILPLNATIRKAISKNKGAEVSLSLSLDKATVALCADLLLCLNEAPTAKTYFNKLPLSHQKYCSKWIETAKTPATKDKRIAQAIKAFELNISYGEMIRMNKEVGG